jgi:hypothetical protein
MVMSSLQIDRVRGPVLWLPWIGMAIQIVVSSTPINMLCALLAASTGWLLLWDSFRNERWQAFPLSSFVLLGIAIVKSLGPLYFTALEGRAVIYNLAVPIRVFGHLTLVSLVAISSHWIYRQWSGLTAMRQGLARVLAGPLAVHQPLSRGAVLLLFVLGCAGWGAAPFFDPAGDGPLAVKIAEGFTLLGSSIVLLVTRPLVKPHGLPPKPLDLQLLGIGMAGLLALSFAVNTRSTFAVPLLTLTLALILEAMFGLIKVTFRAVLAVVLALVLVMPFLTDLATTIVVAREYRGTVEPAELVSLTLEQLSRSEELNERRQEDQEAGTNSWDEVYLSNVFLARFCNLKFDDNALALERDLPPSGRDFFRAYNLERLYATAPRYLLNLFGVDNDEKLTINSRSFGDELYALTTGKAYARGGFRTGHFIGSDLAVFGWWYLLLLALFLVPFYALVDGLQARSSGSILLNPLVITQLVPLLTLSNAESLAGLLQLVLRGIPQVVLTFTVAAWIGRRCFPLPRA